MGCALALATSTIFPLVWDKAAKRSGEDYFVQRQASHYWFVTLLFAGITGPVHDSLAESPWTPPTAQEIQACDETVRAYHQTKYPEERARSDKMWEEYGQPNLLYKRSLHKPERDRILQAETDMTAFLADGHKLPTNQKELAKYIANNKGSSSGYSKTLACTGEARLAAMTGKPKPAPQASASGAPNARTNVPATRTSANSSAGNVDACSNEIRALQLESQSWPGNANDVAARLGRMQKEMFEGRCAGHPDAQAYINGANRMLGYAPGAGSDGTASANSGPAKSGKRSNVPEANASNCLSPQKEGGVINKCAFAIEYSYCVVQPKAGSWAASFDCQQGKSGSWQVGPNSRAIMQTAGLQVAYFGCRYGATLGKPDGISPADFRYNPNGLPTGRCREWGAP